MKFVIFERISIIFQVLAVETSQDDHLANLKALAEDLAEKESRENVHYESIKSSLIRFLQTKQEVGMDTDFTTDDVFQMVKILNELPKKRTEIRENLSKMMSQLRDSKPVEESAITELKIKIECVQETIACVNVEVIAKKLSSPKVRAVVKLIFESGHN